MSDSCVLLLSRFVVYVSFMSAVVKNNERRIQTHTATSGISSSNRKVKYLKIRVQYEVLDYLTGEM